MCIQREREKERDWQWSHTALYERPRGTSFLHVYTIFFNLFLIRRCNSLSLSALLFVLVFIFLSFVLWWELRIVLHIKIVFSLLESCISFLIWFHCMKNLYNRSFRFPFTARLIWIVCLAVKWIRRFISMFCALSRLLIRTVPGELWDFKEAMNYFIASYESYNSFER